MGEFASFCSHKARKKLLYYKEDYNNKKNKTKYNKKKQIRLISR